MGACSSCLGFGRRPSDSPSDTSHLLGDSYQPNYGGINQPSTSHSGRQADPEEIRRQRDALERICAQTTDKLIQVSQSTLAEDGSKMASEYLRLFNERFPALNTRSSRPPSANTNDDEDDGTLLPHTIGDGTLAEHNWAVVEPIRSGDLVIQFGDTLASDSRR